MLSNFTGRRPLKMARRVQLADPLEPIHFLNRLKSIFSVVPKMYQCACTFRLRFNIFEKL